MIEMGRNVSSNSKETEEGPLEAVLTPPWWSSGWFASLGAVLIVTYLDSWQQITAPISTICALTLLIYYTIRSIYLFKPVGRILGIGAVAIYTSQLFFTSNISLLCSLFLLISAKQYTHNLGYETWNVYRRQEGWLSNFGGGIQ